MALRPRQAAFSLALLVAISSPPAIAIDIQAGSLVQLSGGPAILADVMVPEPITFGRPDEWQVAAARGRTVGSALSLP